MSDLDVLVHRVRPASGDPEGLLVFQHGRGTDENDLLGLADVLDRERRLHVVTPRAPLRLEGSPGYHWYVVRRVGYPDPDTFHASYSRLTAFHDALWESTGVAPERTILGGFSMGSVMSYATGLGPGRPRPAGILAFSGFVPSVEGWQPDLETRTGLPVLIAHGRNDPVIAVEFARRARELLDKAELAVEYLESDVGHTIDPAALAEASRWIASVISGSPVHPSQGQ
jgi:phospholipase/carboxylesterase